MRRRLRIHGALDLAFAALYAYLGFAVAPGRALAWNLALSTVILLLAASGVALVAGVKAARPLAVATHALLLAFCATTVALLVAGAAYLRGVYGALGQGAAWVSLVAAALVVELCGLLPIFQLRLLLGAEAKRHFAP